MTTNAEQEPYQAEPGWFSRFIRSRATSLTLKVVVLVVTIQILGLALAMVEELIRERESRHTSVRAEIGALWGGEQVLRAVALEIPFGVPGDRPGIEHTVRKGVAYWLPDTLSLKVELAADMRRRGIFESVVYSADIDASVRLPFPSVDALPRNLRSKFPDLMLFWDESRILVGVSDLKGIRGLSATSPGRGPMTLEPGSNMPGFIGDGLSAPLALDPQSNSAFDIVLSMTLNGSGRLAVAPLGRRTRVALAGDWPDPSFDGGYLPTQYEVSAEGTTATWDVGHFGRGFGQVLIAGARKSRLNSKIAQSVFGMRLLQPITPYRLAERAIKYGMLFLVFTFAFVFIVEALAHRPVHVVQYATVGIPLCLFFLLLVAFAEHMGFAMAYTCGAIAVVSLVGYYAHVLFGRWRHTALICVALGGLYGFLYTLLQLESYSLLWGGVGLWMLTAVFMFTTRRLNWTRSTQTLNEGEVT
jgi:inner membrane protein